MADRLVVGDTVTLGNTFSVGGVATSPTATTLVVTKPDGSTLSYSTAAATLTVTNGVVSKDITADQTGTWSYVWTGTGAAADIEDGNFEIFSLASLRLYVTLADAKSALGLSADADDYELEGAVNAASRAIDHHCRRRFYRDATATARTYTPRNGYVEVDDFWTTTDLAIATDSAADGTFATTWATTDYQLEPLNGVVDGMSGWPYSIIRQIGAYTFPTSWISVPVRVTAKWGWASTPPEVRQAALIKAIRLFKRKESPYGVAGFGEFGVVRLREDPDVVSLIEPYAKGPVIA